MKKPFSHGALFVALLMVPMAMFGKKPNSKFHNRAGQTAHETRYERNCLSSIEVELMGGRATKGYDGTKAKVNALRVYGLNDLGMIGTNAHGAPGVGVNGEILILAGTKGVGIHYDGKFTMLEANLNYTQNFCKGFFLDINVPIKRLEIKDVAFTRAADTLSGTKATAMRNLLAQLTTAMDAYSLNIADAKTTGLGDIMVSGGWTANNDDIENLDFLDTTLKVGVSIPTAKKRDQDKAFELARGHQGNVGVAASFDLGIGFYEWMTLGAHVGGLFFFDKTINMRMQTNKDQSGWLKLLKGDAKVDQGNIWDAGGYLKADHIFKGVSLMFGYNYVHKDKNVLAPVDTVTFEASHVNVDPMLQGWRQHALTVTLEYDMAEEGRRWNPHFSVFYSRPVKGKYIFATDVGGGTAGANIACDF
jgi:hypothetical protein